MSVSKNRPNHRLKANARYRRRRDERNRLFNEFKREQEAQMEQLKLAIEKQQKDMEEAGNATATDTISEILTTNPTDEEE